MHAGSGASDLGQASCRASALGAATAGVGSTCGQPDSVRTSTNGASSYTRSGELTRRARAWHIRYSRTEARRPAQNAAELIRETTMLAIVAAVLFAIALILDLTIGAIGPIGVIGFIAAGLLCLSLQLAGVGAGFRSSRRSRI
jgi:hypothetical protein